VAVRRGRRQSSRFRSAHEGMRHPEPVQSTSHWSDHRRVFSLEGPAGLRTREKRAHQLRRYESQTQQGGHHQWTRDEETVAAVGGEQIEPVTRRIAKSESDRWQQSPSRT